LPAGDTLAQALSYRHSGAGCARRDDHAASAATLWQRNLGLRQSAAMATRRSSFGKDTGLQARMVMTMFLLGLVYVVFIGVLFAAGAGAGLIVIVALVLLLAQFFGSDKIALATMGVKEVTPAQEPELHGIVERLCVQADLPKPKVAVIETSMPNACAMGKSKKNTTVCATRGILELLSPAELEGVMAHELTHVINRDVLVMTLASFFATLASMIAQFALFFGGGFGGGYGRGRDEEEEIMLVLLVSVLVYAISFLLLRALSRYREFAADRGSAVLTGRPSALASALLKISGTMERVPTQDLRKAEPMSAFFILPARTKKSLMNIFADHPPLEQRLAALERLESQLQSAA
jgi:heat shock protein HtpX